MIRRLVDIALAATGLVVLLPVLLAMAVAVRLDGPGAILFRQYRVGRREQPFLILKLRTMRPDHSGALRVSRPGRFLRASKLDELPQLVNVLIGQMSLVGPRPELPDYVALWSAEDRAVVLSVRPGLTDLASIACRHEERLLAAQPDAEAFYRRVLIPRKLRLCRFYVRRAGLGLDLWLIFQTLGALAGVPVRLARLSGLMSRRSKACPTDR